MALSYLDTEDTKQTGERWGILCLFSVTKRTSGVVHMVSERPFNGHDGGARMYSTHFFSFPEQIIVVVSLTEELICTFRN